MMNQIHVWQMVIDLCLVSAILIFSFRWVRGEHAKSLIPRTLELEASLRGLIQEADGAGRHLNEQLMKREQSLQKVLSEIDSAEQKLIRTISLSEDRQQTLSIEEEKAHTVIEQVGSALREFKEHVRGENMSSQAHGRQTQGSQEYSTRPSSQTALQQRDRPAQPRRQQAESEYVPAISSQPPQRWESPRNEEPLAPTFEEMSAQSQSRLDTRPQRQSMPREAFDDRHMTPSPTARTNAREHMTQPTQRQSARSTVAEERVSEQPRARRSNSYTEKSDGQRELQQVYATAESLLKQGKQLEQVSAQTRLPVEEIRLLSQMIEVERNEEREIQKQIQPEKKPAADARLGALSAIRRQNATV